jgi:hypothetical protein
VSEQRGASSTPSLVSFFNTAGNLGFATIRAAFSPPDQPMPQAVVDWILRDFNAMRQWGNAAASCVVFDLTRFDRAASLVQSTRPRARDVWEIVDQMHRDYRTAIQRATCTFGLQAQQLDAFYNGALFMGFATARASYFYYDAPIPPAVVEQIGGDFPMVLSGLRGLGPCLSTLAPIEAQIDAARRRLGTIAGKESYNEMVAIYIAIETALKASACGATAPTTPVPSGSCMRTTCAAPCQGAMSMLGQVSGSPECLACIAKNCP